MQRVVAPAIGFGIFVVSAIGAFLGMVLGFGMKCDDACGEPPPWRRDRDAWQWSALGWSGLAAAAPAAAFFLLLIARRTRAATVVLAGWVVLASAYLVLFDGGTESSDVHRGWIGLGVAAAAAAGAVVLARRAWSRTVAT